MSARVASFVAVLMVIFTAPAAAGPTAASPATAAFLDSLAASEDALPDLGVPAPQAMACSVSNDCGDGNVAACTGNSSCQTTIAGVKCDGTEVRCPNFCTISQTCSCCTGTRQGFCWSKKGDCQYTSEGIACDGHVVSCDSTCPMCPDW